MTSLVLSLNEQIEEIKAQIAARPSDESLKTRYADLVREQQNAFLSDQSLKESLDRAIALSKTVQADAEAVVTTIKGLEARRDQIVTALQSNLFASREEADEITAELAEIYQVLESL